MTKKEKTLVCVADGASAGGLYCGIGVLLVDKETGKILETHSEYVGEGTNNFAEYKAIMKGLETGLELAKKESYTQILVLSDSKLVIEQIIGNFKIKIPELKALKSEVDELIYKCEVDNRIETEFDQIGREFTTKADELAREEAQKGAITNTEKKYPFLKELK